VLDQTSPEAQTRVHETGAANRDAVVAAALDLAASVGAWQRVARRTPWWRRRGRLFDVAAVVVIAFGAVGIFVLGMVAHAQVSDGHGDKSAQAATDHVNVSADDDPALGPSNARVTIIEFSDFQCPYCAQFHAQTLPTILQEYGDRIRFVYRDFPLATLHPFAEKAAEAGECAHEQGAFWPYHDLLFNNQRALDRASLGTYATMSGLKMDAFNGCLDSAKYADEVAADEQAGVAAGVTGTPAFLVNGRLMVGAQPFAVFKAAIDAALAQTN
jgi:protein-disulfide isomerase